MNGMKDAFGDDLFAPRFPVDVRMLKPGDHLELAEGSRLTVAKTPHTDESLAVRIESLGSSLCYTGDTGYSQHLADFFGDADLLISECSFPERREGVPHLSVKDVAQLAELAHVRRLVVTHFYFEVDESALKSQLEKYYSGEVIIGADGMRLELP